MSASYDTEEGMLINGKGPLKNNLGICWRIFRRDYHGAKEEHIQGYVTIEQRDKRPEERQPLGTGIHVFVFFVASPFAYARYAQGLRLKYKRLYFPSNAQFIFYRALNAKRFTLSVYDKRIIS